MQIDGGKAMLLLGLANYQIAVLSDEVAALKAEVARLQAAPAKIAEPTVERGQR